MKYKQFIYNIILVLGFLIALPFYLFKMWKRGKYKDGFSQRFGYYPDEIKSFCQQNPVIWVHAVSVGEVMATLKLLQSLRSRFPEVHLMLTTTTSRGYQVALNKVPEGVKVGYYPLDFLPCVRRALDTLKPAYIILMEGEIWPNMVWEATRRGIPCALANADLSPRSEKRYASGGFFFRDVFSRFNKVFTQTIEDEQRYRAVGVSPESAVTVGSLKFDASIPEKEQNKDIGLILEEAGAGTKPIWIAASTHPGEEEIVLDVFIRLKSGVPNLFLILAPRHDERTAEVEGVLKRKGLKWIRRTDCGVKNAQDDCEVLLINTTGELKLFFPKSTVIFIGNSLVGRKGGHNIIEAAITGKPVVFGKNMQDWQQIADAFIKAGAGVQVEDGEELFTEVKRLILSSADRETIATHAAELIQNNLGASMRTAKLIELR
ncbi:MAG: 3-deoxy-D-manno-octulosonic acid transferase [Verrucomicrobiota bacterium]|nr:3-deoxy-D-manno-octulosonic acid transferase [Verrucomicrobiota bacterium]